MVTRVWVLVAAMAATAAAQGEWRPPKRTNAAFGYWRAFAQMDAPASEDEFWTRARAVTSGGAWDKALDPVIEKNRSALEEMRRGSKLPECDFGLDYEDGFMMLMPHLTKARAIARLNALDGHRLAAHGIHDEAVEAWLAGLRLARHLGQDRTVISSLVAKALGSMSFEAILLYVGRGRPTEEALATLEAGIGELPEYVVEWAEGVALEKHAMTRALEDADKAADAADGMRKLLEMFGQEPVAGEKVDEQLKEAARQLGTTLEELKDQGLSGIYRRWRKEYEDAVDATAAALREPAWVGLPRLREIQKSLPEKNLIIALAMPAVLSLGESRARLELDRAAALAMIHVVRRVRATKDWAAFSLEGAGLPVDPFSGKVLLLEATEAGLKICSEGKDGDGKEIEYEIRK